MQARDLAENATDTDEVISIGVLNGRINELYNSARLYSDEFGMVDRHYYRSALNDVSRVIMKLPKQKLKVMAEWKYAGYEERDFKIYAKYECTNCGQVEKGKEDRYCRGCGAYMKGGISAGSEADI